MCDDQLFFSYTSSSTWPKPHRTSPPSESFHNTPIPGSTSTPPRRSRYVSVNVSLPPPNPSLPPPQYNPHHPSINKRILFAASAQNLAPSFTLHFSKVFAHHSSSYNVAFLIFSLIRNPWPSPSIITSLTSPPFSLIILSISLA